MTMVVNFFLHLPALINYSNSIFVFVPSQIEQLKKDNSSLVKQMDQLQKNNSELAGQVDQFKKDNSDLVKNTANVTTAKDSVIEDLRKTNNTLTIQLAQLQVEIVEQFCCLCHDFVNAD